MRKILLKNLTFIFLLFVLTLTINVNAKETKSQTVGQSKYEEGELVEESMLKEGVLHQKYVSYSSSGLTGFNAAGSGGGGLNVANQLYPQCVNLLFIPNNTNAKIVNWTSIGSSGWNRGTVVNMAKNFEQNNPGWKVIAAINADFFDINSNNPLPYTTTGSCVADGDVLKTVGSRVIGFTNDGTANTLIGNQSLKFDDYYTLTLYNDNYEVIGEYPIDSVNKSYTTGISLYYSYPVFQGDSTTRVTVANTLPKGGFIANAPERCIPYNANSFFGKGKVVLNDSDKELEQSKFGIYTTNQAIIDAINSAYEVRVQRNIAGDYSNATSITGCGDTLIKDGEGCVLNNKERHPRTMVGVKADGTLVFCTVDGRQPDDNMYGMTLDEQAALMLTYDCVAAYNLDGGGSTTMVVRENDEFVVKNTPSDKYERSDANALLVVIPEVVLNVSEVLDTTAKISMPNKIKNFEVANIVLDYNGKKYPLNDFVVIKNLEPNSNCQINYTYDRVYNGKYTTITGNYLTIKTGKIIPTLKEAKYTYKDGELKLNYKFDDPHNTLTMVKLSYGSGSKILDLEKQEIVITNLNNFNPDKLSITAFYELMSQTDDTVIKNFDSSFFTEEQQKTKGCGKATSLVLMSIMAGAILIIIKKR